jgi:hypothetical protein
MHATTTPHAPASALARTVLASVVALVLVLVGGAAATAEAAEESRKPAAGDAQLQTFGIGPADRDGLDRRGAFVYAGPAGTVVEDRVAVLNYTEEPLRTVVYASDAYTTEAGAFDVLAADAEPTDLGAWIDFEPRTVRIPPRSAATGAPGQRILPFTLTVPADATPGDHAGGIVASIRSAGDGTTNSVVVDRRVGTRISMRVSGAVDPRLEVSGLTASYSGTANPAGRGTTTVEYVVRNTGNVALSARQEVVVGPGFAQSWPSAPVADLVGLLPGAAVPVTVEVPGTWPLLRMSADVTLVPFTGTSEAPTDLAPVSASVSFWAVPWTAIGLLLLLLIAAALLAHRRRGRGAAPLPTDEPALVVTS